MEDIDETQRMIFRIIYIFRRIMDQTMTRKHITAENRLNITYWPYIMNIGQDGILNTALVHQIKVTRQAVSKTIREMEQSGLVHTVKSGSDARALMITLTEEGKILYQAIKADGDDLSQQYRKILGSARYEKMIDSLLDLVRFHEDLEKK